MAHTLLLADDSGTTHRVIELTFADQGIRVIGVTDGDQAVEKLSSERPDIVLAAIALPKLNGYEVASFVRRHAALRDVPVLLLTGAFDSVDDARLRESGAAGVLVKPFEHGVVLNRVKELLGLGTETPQPPTTSGRLVTHVDPPRARPAMSDSWQPPPPKQLDPLPSARSASPQRPATPEIPSWDQLREDTGLGPDAAHVEGPGSSGGDDYFDQLDAAFDTLDAQLAGKAAPRGRVAPQPPTPRMPAAIDPAMRPMARDLHHAVPTTQDEIETVWDTAEPPAAPAESRRPAPAPVPAPPPVATRPAFPVAKVLQELPAAATPPVEPRVEADAARATVIANPLPEMADAFAALLAEEQGEPVNHTQPAFELNDDVIDRIASRVADKLSHSLLMDHVTRIVSDVAERVVREEIARIRAAAKGKT